LGERGGYWEIMINFAETNPERYGNFKNGRDCSSNCWTDYNSNCRADCGRDCRTDCGTNCGEN
jgi:hypothetical protein